MNDIEAAKLDVAGDIGLDINYLNPPHEKHFDPATLVFSVAGEFVLAYLLGILKQLIVAGSIELGKFVSDELGRYHAERGAEYIKKRLASDSSADQTLTQVAHATASLSQKMTVADLRAISETSEAALIEALEELHFPKSQARKIAKSVQKHTNDKILKSV